MIPCRGCNDTGQNGAELSTDACSNVAVRANTPIHGGEIPAFHPTVKTLLPHGPVLTAAQQMDERDNRRLYDPAQSLIELEHRWMDQLILHNHSKIPALHAAQETV